jgi:WD40 repeat protein
MRSTIAVFLLLFSMPITVLAQSARQEKTITLPAGVSVEIASASVSPTGNLVAAICTDNMLRVWSAKSGELVRSLKANTGAHSAVQFSGDGSLLAVAYEIVAYEKGTIQVFDADSWKLEQELTSLPLYAVIFSPDSRRLSNTGDLGTEIWDLKAQKKVAHVSPPFGGSAALSYSPDGKWVATADQDTFVRVYDAGTGNLHSTLQGSLLEPTAVAFAAGGKSLVIGRVDKTVSVIDPDAGKVIRVLPKQPGLIWSIDVAADGKRAVIGYNNAERPSDIHHLTLWDLDQGVVLADFQKPGLLVTGGAFVGDHYLFVAASGNQLSLWSLP